MKKNNKFLRIATVLLIVAMVTTVALTGTLARYTSAATVASQSIRVAAWDIEVSADGDTWVNIKEAAGILTLLGDQLKSHNVIKSWEKALAADDDVWEPTELSFKHDADYGDISFLVFPGVGAWTNIYVKNNSEVPARVSIQAPATAGAIDAKLDVIQVAIGQEFTEMPDDAAFTGTLANVAAIASSGDIDPGETEKIGIAWKWDYIGDDTIDCDGEDCGEANCISCDPSYDAGEAGNDAADTVLGEFAATGENKIAGLLAGAKIVVTQID